MVPTDNTFYQTDAVPQQMTVMEPSFASTDPDANHTSASSFPVRRPSLTGCSPLQLPVAPSSFVPTITFIHSPLIGTSASPVDCHAYGSVAGSVIAEVSSADADASPSDSDIQTPGLNTSPDPNDLDAPESIAPAFQDSISKWLERSRTQMKQNGGTGTNTPAGGNSPLVAHSKLSSPKLPNRHLHLMSSPAPVTGGSSFALATSAFPRTHHTLPLLQAALGPAAAAARSKRATMEGHSHKSLPSSFVQHVSLPPQPPTTTISTPNSSPPARSNITSSYHAVSPSVSRIDEVNETVEHSQSSTVNLDTMCLNTPSQKTHAYRSQLHLELSKIPRPPASPPNINNNSGQLQIPNQSPHRRSPSGQSTARDSLSVPPPLRQPLPSPSSSAVPSPPNSISSSTSLLGRTDCLEDAWRRRVVLNMNVIPHNRNSSSGNGTASGRASKSPLSGLSAAVHRARKKNPRPCNSTPGTPTVEQQQSIRLQFPRQSMSTGVSTSRNLPAAPSMSSTSSCGPTTRVVPSLSPLTEQSNAVLGGPPQVLSRLHSDSKEPQQQQQQQHPTISMVYPTNDALAMPDLSRSPSNSSSTSPMSSVDSNALDMNAPDGAEESETEPDWSALCHGLTGEDLDQCEVATKQYMEEYYKPSHVDGSTDSLDDSIRDMESRKAITLRVRRVGYVVAVAYLFACFGSIINMAASSSSYYVPIPSIFYFTSAVLFALGTPWLGRQTKYFRNLPLLSLEQQQRAIHFFAFVSCISLFVGSLVLQGSAAGMPSQAGLAQREEWSTWVLCSLPLFVGYLLHDLHTYATIAWCAITAATILLAQLLNVFWLAPNSSDANDPVMLSHTSRWYYEFCVQMLCLLLNLFFAQAASHSIRSHIVQLWSREQFMLQQGKNLAAQREAAFSTASQKSTFLASMSHEIRTPINGVIGLCSLVLESELTQDQRDCLTTVIRSGETLLCIINDILLFSKLEAGQLLIERLPFNPMSATEDVLDIFSLLAQQQDNELIAHFKPGLPSVCLGDVMRLRQILTNLCSNALKFSKRGGEVIVTAETYTPTAEELQYVAENRNRQNRRQVSDESGDEQPEPAPIENLQQPSTPSEYVYLRFSVTDFGTGIPKSKHKKLFHAFSQVDASDSRKAFGTGLGLSIAKRLVELMDGRIGFESEVGVGSTFYFYIRCETTGNQKNMPPAPAAVLPVIETEKEMKEPVVVIHTVPTAELAIEIRTDDTNEAAVPNPLISDASSVLVLPPAPKGFAQSSPVAPSRTQSVDSTQDATPSALASSHPFSRYAAKFLGKRALIVDKPRSASALKQLMEQWGLQVTTCTSEVEWLSEWNEIISHTVKSRSKQQRSQTVDELTASPLTNSASAHSYDVVVILDTMLPSGFAPYTILNQALLDSQPLLTALQSAAAPVPSLTTTVHLPLPEMETTSNMTILKSFESLSVPLLSNASTCTTTTSSAQITPMTSSRLLGDPESVAHESTLILDHVDHTTPSRAGRYLLPPVEQSPDLSSRNLSPLIMAQPASSQHSPLQLGSRLSAVTDHDSMLEEAGPLSDHGRSLFHSPPSESVSAAVQALPSFLMLLSQTQRHARLSAAKEAGDRGFASVIMKPVKWKSMLQAMLKAIKYKPPHIVVERASCIFGVTTPTNKHKRIESAHPSPHLLHPTGSHVRNGSSHDLLRPSTSSSQLNQSSASASLADNTPQSLSSAIPSSINVSPNILPTPALAPIDAGEIQIPSVTPLIRHYSVPLPGTMPHPAQHTPPSSASGLDTPNSMSPLITSSNRLSTKLTPSGRRLSKKGTEKPPNANLRILVAEDHTVNQMVIKRMLNHLGYSDVTIANDGVECLEMMSLANQHQLIDGKLISPTRPYDLLLIDKLMPRLGGIGTTKRIRARVCPQLQPRIVAVTANVLPADQQACVEAGCQEFLAKPILLPELRQVLISCPFLLPSAAAAAAAAAASTSTIITTPNAGSYLTPAYAGGDSSTTPLLPSPPTVSGSSTFQSFVASPTVVMSSPDTATPNSADVGLQSPFTASNFNLASFPPITNTNVTVSMSNYKPPASSQISSSSSSLSFVPSMEEMAPMSCSCCQLWAKDEVVNGAETD